jgi:flagellin-like protein
MMRLFRNRKAVSPVISTVLMILIVITGMSLLFAFFVNYTRDFQTGSGSAVLESMVIEDVWFKDTGQVEVWVYNVGRINFDITAVYVNGTWANINAGSDFAVSVGKHGRLTVTSQLPYALYNTYDFKIVTERGSAFEGRYRWQ